MSQSSPTLHIRTTTTSVNFLERFLSINDCSSMLDVCNEAQLRLIYSRIWTTMWLSSGSVHCARTNVDLYYVAGPSHRVSIAHNFFFNSNVNFSFFCLSFWLSFLLLSELSRLFLENHRTIWINWTFIPKYLGKPNDIFHWNNRLKHQIQSKSFLLWRLICLIPF